MTAVSLVNPYASQPAAVAGLEGRIHGAQTVQPVSSMSASDGPGSSTDQSGSGAGNGSGSGGSDQTLADRQARARASVLPSRPTPKSVVDAQAHWSSVEDMRQKVQDRKEADRAQHETIRQEKTEQATRERAAEAREASRLAAEEAKERKARFPMPDPLPTAPILKREA